jgi:hypothetical protein
MSDLKMKSMKCCRTLIVRQRIQTNKEDINSKTKDKRKEV